MVVTVHSSAPAPDRLVGLTGFRIFAAFWGSLLAVDVGRSVSSAAWPSTLLVAITVCLCSLGQGPPVAAVSAVTGWLFLTGFVVNDGGELAVTGPGDAGRLLSAPDVRLSVSGAPDLDAILTLRSLRPAGGRHTFEAITDEVLGPLSVGDA